MNGRFCPIPLKKSLSNHLYKAILLLYQQS
ncbi:MAG: hypothetical protein JWQ23_4132 [Herminiimonas sp.]|nr:hypothetical protein [Herminiimonas sp.]